MEMTGWHLINDGLGTNTCTHWLIAVQHWCHLSYCNSSSPYFAVSSAVLSVKLRLLFMLRQIPFVVLCFWQTGHSLFPTVQVYIPEVMLKCCATLATPTAAPQRVYGENNPLMRPKHLHVRTGGRLLQLAAVTLEIFTSLCFPWETGMFYPTSFGFLARHVCFKR